ncbi:MAG: prolyl oligopeptidase family serine peptidase [Draconibacterium sp.]|nr:prolyl oligopeptidase family serine peptidase [Draconibacterium sp.]
MKFALTFILIVFGTFVQSQTAKDKKKLEQFNYENIIYKIVDDDTLDMILFLPKEKMSSNSPVMLFTHGGGWGGGNKYKIFNPVFNTTLKILLENDIACATIEYRLTRVGKSNAHDCVTDCKDASRFLIKHAEKYLLDANRMGVWGGSAGGHLSLMTALGNNKDFIGDKLLSTYNPQFLCAVSYFPLTSFVETELLKGSNFEKPNRFIPILGGLLSEKKDLARALSPAKLLNSKSPPILLLHGNKDKVLPISQSLHMQEVAKKIGANVKLLTVENAGHSFQGENISPSIDQINRISADFIMGNLIIIKKEIK